MKKAAAGAMCLGVLAVALLAVTPQKWVIGTMDDVLNGTSLGISVSSEGEIVLAPSEEAAEGPAEEFYLSLAAAPDGTIYLGTGHSGKVFKVPREGKPELYFQAGEMDVTSLAVGPNGTLFAGTSPNGKVYKVKDKGKAEVFFDPGEKYIWSLLPEEEGGLLVAVGETGGVYEVSAQGSGRLILKVPENHILCLKRDKSGILWAGSGGNGLLYQWKAGKAFVVYESPFEEIKGLDFDGDGNILVAASGTPVKTKKEEIPLASTAAAPEVEITVTPSKQTSPESTAPIATSALAPSAAGKEPSALFVVTPEGEAKKIWSSAGEMIYSVLWRQPEKKALLGTGPRGRLYAVGEDGRAVLLLQKASEQVFSLLPLLSRTAVLSDNPPHLDFLSSEQRFEGEYRSAVQDAKLVSSWGVISWLADIPQGATLRLETRSGNSSEPGPSWSDWSPPYQNGNGEPILSPKARFLQFRALFKTPSGRVSPRLQRVTLNYLQTNVAPIVRQVSGLAPNVVLLKPPDSEDVIWGAAKALPAAGAEEKEEGGLKSPALAKKAERKGLQTILWEASDENGDGLSYAVMARKEGETVWHVLEPEWTDQLYAFDTTTLPDGVYRFKIVASDAPSNPAGLALTGEGTSGPIVIDNTAPVIKNAVLARDQNMLRVSFEVEDNLSPVVEVKCIIRPGEWQTVFPVDGICDSLREAFKLNLALPANPDTMLIIQAKDGHGNVGVYRQGF
jgi:hypothetical protein